MRRLGPALAVILLASLLPSNLAMAATAKAGGSCAKLKSTSIVNGYKFTCIKSGKKSVWSKGVKVATKPTPAVTPAPVVSPSPTPSVTPTVSPSPATSVTPTVSPSPTPTPTPTPSTGQAKFTLDEVKKHSSSNDCWTVVDGGVYDLTNWAALHPVGPAFIQSLCGRDGTSDFLGWHANQPDPMRTLLGYFVGKLGA